MRISAEFVTSAAGASGFPGDHLPEIALVGRSNVGKSSLINALTRQRIARASAAPGKTRLANVYRVKRGHAAPLYLVDLPGYGYARGGSDAAREFEALTRAYFARRESALETDGRRSGSLSWGPVDDARGRESTLEAEEHRRRGQAWGWGPTHVRNDDPVSRSLKAALLVVDARHPGLDSDRAAWTWLKGAVAAAAIVATKIDKLPRGQRIRGVRELESVFEDAVLPVSAVTGEGLDELWNQIDRLANSRNPQLRRSRSNSSPNRLPRATAAPLRKK